jgi:plastocyanin
MARRSAILIGAAAVGVLAVAVAPGGVAADPHAQAAAAVKEVSIGDNFFSPVKVRVRRLHKVRWTNNGQVEHNVTFPGGYSRNVGPGGSVVKKFNGAKFPIPYSCTIHPGMTGKVKVLPFG